MDDDFKGIQATVLDESNYSKWSITTEYRLTNKNVWPIVLVDTPFDEMSAAQRTMNSKALACIGLLVSDHLLHTVSRHTTAHGAWQALADIYRGRSEARRTYLRGKLTHLKMERGETLIKYFSRAEELRDELSTVGHDVSDEDLRMSVLAGLPGEYATHVAILQMVDEQLRLNELLSKLMIIEQTTKAENTTPAYFTAGRRGPPRGGSRNFHPSRPYNLAAGPQQGPGHIPRRGFSSQAPRGNPAACRPAPPPGANHSRGPRCYGCNEFGHIRRDCPKERNSVGGQRTVALAATDHELFSDNSWVVDSGSSYHITNQRSMFGTKLDALEQPIDICFANGEKARAAGVGDISFETYTGTSITLRRALYVPDAKVNMLSVQRAA